MSVKITRQMIEEAVKTYKYKRGTPFKLTSELKPQTLKNVTKHIAKGINGNDIIAAMSLKGIFGDGKDGMALSENRLYFSKDYSRFNNNKLSSVDISDFKTVKKCTSGSLKGVGLTIEYENGEKLSFYTSIFTGDILNFFKMLMILRGDNIEEPKKRKTSKTASAPEPDSEKAEVKSAEKSEVVSASNVKSEPAPIKAEPAITSTPVKAPAVNPSPIAKAEPKPAHTEAAAYSKPQVNFESVQPALKQELKDRRVDHFRHFPKGGDKYPTLFIPFELDGEIYVPTYMQRESDGETEHQLYRIISIFDGSDDMVDAAKTNGEILSVFLISKQKEGYEEADIGEAELKYVRQVFGFNYAPIPSYLVLGIYLNGNKILDLQENKTYDLIGCEQYKNNIKEKDFVIACCHNGKYYIVEVRKPKICKNYYYVNGNWCTDKEGTVSKIPYSTFSFSLTNVNGTLNSKFTLPNTHTRCTVYCMDDYADAFYNQPIVYTIEEDESKKSVAAPAKTNAKVALVSKKLNRYNVFNLFGEICICTASKESHKDTDGKKSRTYYYEYHYHSLDSQQEKLILFTKTEKTETVSLGRNKAKTDIPPDIKIDKYGNYEKTEVLKTSYELYSDTKDEGYGKAGRHEYLAYSKRIPETEFTIYESKCCTVKHIGGNVFEDVVSGIKYPLHDSYPTNKGGFSDNYCCGAVVFENKVYPVHNLRFENSVLAQYKDGKFIFFDGQLLSEYYSYSLPLEKHIKILRLNGRDTVYAPKEGEYYELSYTYHHDYYFKELLFMKPLKLTPVYGVLQAAKAANEYSCRGEAERDIDFRDSAGNPYYVLPYTIPGDTYDKITDKVCFARILAKESDSSGKSYAIVDKLYYGSEMEMTSISSNSMGHTLKQKGGSLTLSIPDRCVHFTIKEGYKVLCTVCRNQDFASVNRESALIYVNKVLKETKKEVTLPSVNKLTDVELTNLKKGDILYNYETFIATYNVTINDDCGMTDVIIDGIDLKEQRVTIEYLSFGDHVKVYNRKLLSIDLLPCEIKGDILIITTKNKELVYLDEEMTHKVFDSNTPPKKVYAYHYGNIYYFACGERDETCV